MAPKFTQRHHQAVADIFWIRAEELRSVGPTPVHQNAHWHEWMELQARFRNLFAGDNYRFRPDTFDRACGIKG